MSRRIQVRLDEETENVRRELTRRFGWSNSRLVREAIKALAHRLAGPQRRTIIGQGAFQSNQADLGWNEDRLSDYGR